MAAVLGLLGFGSALCNAQATPKSPNGMPDVVGVYPGMPVGDAYNLMKAYYPTRGGRVDVHQDAIQGLNGNKPLATQLHIPPADQQGTRDDVIDVFITLPPNKQAVWAVTRIISFEESKSPSAEALVAGLRQKYGPEMPGAQHYPSGVSMRWIFDRQGKRVADSFVRCSQISNPLADSIPRVLVYNPSPAQFGNLILTPAGLADGEACKTFVYLAANIAIISGVTSSLQLSLYDLGMGLNAGLRTQAVIHGVANAEAQQAEQQQKKVDKSAVPQF
jgi:hypothetical protein